MQTLEEQIRLYAADVIGPPLPHSGPVSPDDHLRNRIGKFALAAALVVFVAGLGYLLVSRQPANNLPTTTPAVSNPYAELVSTAGEVGSCGDGFTGVRFHGVSGEGLCVAVGDEDANGIAVWNVADDAVQDGGRYPACAEVTPGLIKQSSGGPGSGGVSTFWSVSRQTATLVVPLASGNEIHVDTIEITGIAGSRFAAAWIPSGDEQAGAPQQFDLDGAPVDPESTLTGPC